MATASTEKHLINRGWQKLTPMQHHIILGRDLMNQKNIKSHDRLLMRLLGSLVYEVTKLNGDTFIRRL